MTKQMLRVTHRLGQEPSVPQMLHPANPIQDTERKAKQPIEEKPRDTTARAGKYYEPQEHWHIQMENPLRKMPCPLLYIISQHETVGWTHAGR